MHYQGESENDFADRDCITKFTILAAWISKKTRRKKFNVCCPYFISLEGVPVRGLKQFMDPS